MAHLFLPVLNEVEKASIDERQPLPDRYRGLDDEEMDRRIAAARATLGSRLLILGHHYQRDEVIKFADFIGDSFSSRGIAPRAPTPSSSSSAACTSWPKAPTCSARRISR